MPPYFQSCKPYQLISEVWPFLDDIIYCQILHVQNVRFLFISVQARLFSCLEEFTGTLDIARDENNNDDDWTIRQPNRIPWINYKSCSQANMLPPSARSIWFYFSLFVEVPQRWTQIELLDLGRYCRHLARSIQSTLKGQTRVRKAHRFRTCLEKTNRQTNIAEQSW